MLKLHSGLRRKHVFYTLALTLLTSLWGAVAKAQGQVQIAPLPSPGPERLVRLAGVNDQGVVFGASCTLSDATKEMPFLRAWLWSKESTNSDLGALGAEGAALYGMNNRGVGVGILQRKPKSSSNGGRPLLLAFVGTEAGIALLPGPGGETVARAINEEGRIVGAARNPNGNSIAVCWAADKARTLTELGRLGGSASDAVAINARNFIVGHSLNAKGVPHACVWNAEKKIVDIGPDGLPSWATDINDENQVVGWVLAKEGQRACYWNSAGRNILGTLGGQHSALWSINNRGIAVGFADLPDKSRHAMGFDGQKMVDLNTLLPKDSGWVLVEARAINNQNQITGYGSFKGQPTTFLLTVTEGPKQPFGVRVEPRDIKGGDKGRGIIMLDAPAPKGGAEIALTSSDTKFAQIPAKVVVAEGKNVAEFEVKTSAVTEPKTILLKVSYAATKQSAQAEMKVMPPPPAGQFGVRVEPRDVRGGETARGWVMLGGPAPKGGVLVKLSSNDAAAGVPATVTIAEGKDGAEFPVKTVVVKEPKTILLKASANNDKLKAQFDMKVMPANAPALRLTVFVDPMEMVGGMGAKGTVGLGGPAPKGGATITLSSSDAKVLEVPGTIVIPEGKDRMEFPVKTFPVTELKPIALKANYATAKLEVVVNVRVKPGENKPKVTMRFDPASVKGGSATKLIIEASEATPAAGVTIRLSSSDAKIVPVPAEVKIPGGVKRFEVPIQTNTVTENKKVTVKMNAVDLTLEAALGVNAK
jgi:uncharacterized membrane protein